MMEESKYLDIRIENKKNQCREFECQKRIFLAEYAIRENQMMAEISDMEKRLKEITTIK